MIVEKLKMKIKKYKCFFIIILFKINVIINIKNKKKVN